MSLPAASTNVPLVEDAAEALGGTYQGRPAGVFGDLAIFSFNGNKIITTSGGGALVSDRKEWIDKARFLATQARDPAPHGSTPTSATNTASATCSRESVADSSASSTNGSSMSDEDRSGWSRSSSD